MKCSFNSFFNRIIVIDMTKQKENLRQIKIEKLAYGGAGVGYIDGKVCFVEGALPGEIVDVEVAQTKSRYEWAKLRGVIKPSKDREAPRCQHYGMCGGCQYQHVSYAEELKWKTLQVREYLVRQTGIDESLIEEIVSSPSAYGTRMHFTAKQTKSNKLGYVARDNRTVFEVKECPLLETLLEEKLSESFSGQPKHSFRLAHDQTIVASSDKTLYQVKVGESLIWAHSAAFFQANRAIANKIGTVLKGLVDEIQPDWFVDLFSGCGLFSLLAADKVPNLFLAESNRSSLAALEKNFEKTTQNVVVAEGDAGELFADWFAQAHPKKMCLFVDPPRQGLEASFAKKLSQVAGQPILTYLSCHLGSLTRDLGILLKKGHWKIDKVIPFDMFPRTKHIEILTILRPAP